MTDNRISMLINILRCAKCITPLQKDILDTWNALQKNPFDTDTAHRQIVSNNMNHPDLFLAISAMPGIVQKSGDALTPDDMVFTLRHQLDGLVGKELNNSNM